MINLLSLGIVGGIGGAIGIGNLWINRDINQVKKDWKDTLLTCNINGIKVKVADNVYHTFLLTNVTRFNNGYKATTYIPRGLQLSALKNALQCLEDNLDAKIEIEKSWDCKFVNVTITTRKPDISFRKIECSSDFLFGGFLLNGEPNLINLNTDPHLLVTGKSGTGKTIALFLALTNLLANKDKNFELHFAQIVNRELSLFSECKNVVGFYKTFEDVEKMLKKIMKIKEHRNDLLEETGCRNISQYNQYYPRNKQKRIFIICEEFSFFKVTDSDLPDVKKLKASCETMLLELVKAGRSNLITVITVLQRPSATNMDTTIRSQVSVLSYKQKSEGDSKMAVGIGGAEALSLREGIFDGQSEILHLLYPDVDDDLECLKELVPEIKLPENPQVIKKKSNIFDEFFYSVFEDKKVEEKEKDLYEETQILKLRAKVEHMEITNLEYNPSVQIINEIDTHGLFDKQIKKFIEDFGGITVNQCEWMFYKNNNNARRRLQQLEKNGVLFSYPHNSKEKEKVYGFIGQAKKLSTHEVLINNFFAKLVYEGIEVLEFNRFPNILNDTRRPDLYVRYFYKGKEYRTYLECDYTSFTGQDKINDYDTAYKRANEKFNLFIMKEKDLIFEYKGNMKIKHLPLSIKKIKILE